MIDPGFWSNDELGALSPITRLLYMGTISLADDYGRLKDESRYLKGQLFCYDDDIDVGNIEDMLAALSKAALIQRYEVAGKKYLAHPNWLSYQQISPSKRQPSKIPPPPVFVWPRNFQWFLRLGLR